MEITKKEFERIRDLKVLDIQQCSFCHRLNILNLGWKPFRKLYCRLHEAEYILCWELCYKVCLNIWGCQLYQEAKEVSRKPIQSNRKYNWANCYFCFKELKGAGKTGIVKNRNNSSFWGIGEKFISCLECLRKKYYGKLEKEKRKMLNKYVRRGYI